jgi:KTSC domain-containing protein
MPEMQPVASSSIAAIGYDADKAELYIRFYDAPGTWVYYGVGALTAKDFLRAESKGAFFNEVLKGKYRYARLA